MDSARIATLALVFSVLALSQFARADEAGNALANFNDALGADIHVSNAPLIKTPAEIKVTAEIRNDNDEAVTIYLLKQNATGGWDIAKLIGQVAPKSKMPLDLTIEASYDKVSTKKTKYALVGRGESSNTYGKFFDVTEDWSGYERDVRDSLSSLIVTWAPIVAIILVVLVIITAKIAYTSKTKGEIVGEYTMRSLLFPETANRPTVEKFADILINPITIAFELLCIGVLVAVMLDSMAKTAGFDDALKVLALSALGAFSIPFIYFAAAWLFERREEGKPLRFFAGMFFWGMFAAFLSLIVSSALLGSLKEAGAVTFAIISTMLIAPVVEEAIKGSGVLMISGHHDFNDTLTGLLMGFTCGVGFAFVENWFYFAFRTNPFEMGLGSWGMLIIYRSFFNTLAHGFFTAAASTAMGYCKGVEKLRKFAKLAFLPGIFIAISIHMIYNLSALADSFAFGDKSMPFFIFNPMLIILLATAFFLVLVFATIDEKKRKTAARAFQGANLGTRLN